MKNTVSTDFSSGLSLPWMAVLLLLLTAACLTDSEFLRRLGDPVTSPRLFAYVDVVGQISFLHGLVTFLLRMLAYWLCGFALGLGLAAVIARQFFVRPFIRFLRVCLWAPFLLVFVTPSVFVLGTAAVMFATCYFYLANQTSHNDRVGLSWETVLGRSLLQALCFALVVELWFPVWVVYKFPTIGSVVVGLGIVFVVLVLVAVIHWAFRLDLRAMARFQALALDNERSLSGWRSICTGILGSIILGGVWFGLVAVKWINAQSTPFGIVQGSIYLFSRGEIWSDILMTLIEVASGLALGGTIGFFLTPYMKTDRKNSQIVTSLVALCYPTAITIWLLVFYLAGMPLFAGRIMLVTILVVCPFAESLLGHEDRPIVARIACGADSSLPFAFVAALLAEAYASTQGLGFLMVVAAATYQTNFGVVGFLVTILLLLGLSCCLRIVAKTQS